MTTSLTISRTKFRRISLVCLKYFFVAFVVINFFKLIIWNSYHSLIMNDGDSILFLSYAQNLTTCSNSTSRLLMIDANFDDCRSLVNSQDYTFYSDHPSGFIIILSILYRLGFESLYSMRWISVLVSSMIVFLLYIFSSKNVNHRFGLLVAVGFMVTPLFVFHSVVIHIFTWAQLLSVMVAIVFVKEIFRPNKTSKLCFVLLLLIGFTIDWPVFVLAIVLCLASFYLKRFDLAAILIFCSIPSYLLIRFWISLGSTSNQVGIIEELVSSIGRGEELANLMAIPFYFFKAHFIGVLGLISFIYFAFKLRSNFRENPIIILGTILLLQGVLNVVLFLPWASSHIYWTYFLIPTSAFGFAMAFQKISGMRRWFSGILVSTILLTSVYSYVWWAKDYVKPPISFDDYFDQKGLKSDWLSNSSKIYTLNRDVYIGQSAKIRLQLDKSFNLISGVELPSSGYLVVKSGTKVGDSLKKPIELDWFEWDVYILGREQI